MNSRLSQNAETSISIDVCEPWNIKLMKKPEIKRILEIMDLDILLPDLVKQKASMPNTKSNQNEPKQFIELIKLNIKMLRYEPVLLQSESDGYLKELDRLLRESHSTQANAQHDLAEKSKKIYDLLDKVKATPGPVEFDQKSIQQLHEEFQAEYCRLLSLVESNIDPNKMNHDKDDDMMVNLLQVRLRPDSARSNLKLVKKNLEQLNQVLNEISSASKSIDPIDWMVNLIKMSNDLIRRISSEAVDTTLSKAKDDSDWAQMTLDAMRFISGQFGPKPQLYIATKDSSNDIHDQVTVMYELQCQKNEQSQRNEERHGITGQSFDRNTTPDVTEINYTWCGSFHRDIFMGKLAAVEVFLKENPLALATKITSDGNTALHIAVKARKLNIVTKLLTKLKKKKKLIETLEKKNKEGKTALYIAASGGFPTIVEELVKANRNTLLIDCDNTTIPSLPLFVAAKYDNKAIVKYIYDEMQKIYKEEKERIKKEKEEEEKECIKKKQKEEEKESSGEHQEVLEFFPKENEKAKIWAKQWASFLANLIYNEQYDMALCVNDDYPSLALLRYTEVETPLFALAQSPSLGANKTAHDKASKSQLFRFTGGNKIDCDSTSKASKLLKQIIPKIDLQSQKTVLSDALFKAAEVGSVEFVSTILNSLPLVVSWLNDDHQNIFHVAIKHRQENIFNLIYGLGPVMNDLAGSADKFNNWMLHLAGTLAPHDRLNQVPSAALQLQRELKWFEAVEAIVPKISINVKNLSNHTPHELFATEHEDLMKAGEKWIKNTASSCSIVAALITTVMFAAAFTVPGGNDQDSGDPMFLTDNCFFFFVISDAAALFSSCTSVLIFLAILTSRFAQQDFLISLPKWLISGLVLLFISMVTMMIAFGVAIYIIIRHRYDWFFIPVILAGLVPVCTFLWMISKLLIDLWRATFSSIFVKTTRHLYY